MIEAKLIHDATVKALHIAWAEGLCAIELSTVRDGDVRLVFEAFVSVLVPRAMPWGPSVSVNAMRETGARTFELELQSGDVIRIEALNCKLVSGEHEKL